MSELWFGNPLVDAGGYGGDQNAYNGRKTQKTRLYELKLKKINYLEYLITRLIHMIFIHLLPTKYL